MGEGRTELIARVDPHHQETVMVTMGLMLRGFGWGATVAAVALIGGLAFQHSIDGGGAVSGWWLIVDGLIVVIGTLLGGFLGIASTVLGRGAAPVPILRLATPRREARAMRPGRVGLCCWRRVGRVAAARGVSRRPRAGACAPTDVDRPRRRRSGP